MTNLETIIAEKVHALPLEKQTEVLLFVENLEGKEEVNGGLDSKKRGKKLKSKSKRFSFVGIGSSKTGDLSVRAEEILMEEIDKRSGWTVKDERLD